MHRFHWTEHVGRLRLRRSLVMSYFELISKRNFEEKKIKPGLSNARMRQFVKIMKNCEIRMKWKGSKYFTWSTLGQILWHILNMFWTIEIRVTVIDAFGKNSPYIIKTRRKEKRKHSPTLSIDVAAWNNCSKQARWSSSAPPCICPKF